MNLKRVLSIILTLCMLLSIMTFPAMAATTSGTTGNCTWMLEGTVLTISGNGSMGNYTGSSPSPWSTNITSVVIENGVVNIGGYAFSGCSNLTSITIPNSVTSIESGAFSGCDSLKNVYITDLVAWCKITFGSYSSNPLYAENLYINNEKVTNLVIPDNVTRIKDYAFYDSNLVSIYIPDSVKSIGKYAFYSCSSLTSINIPDGVASIEDSTFGYCSSLTSLTIPDSVKSFGSYVFSNCTSLVSTNIPDGVTNTSGYMFNNCSSLTSLIIPDSIKIINEHSFYGCSSLTSFTIPDIVTAIGDYAFYGCSSLNSLTVPDSVTSIGWYAFSGCSNLSNITIGSGVANIWDNAFWRCTNLEEINVDEDNQNFSSVDGVLFNKNKTVLERFPEGKTGNYIIPNGVSELYNWSFRNCTNLTSLIIPSSVTYIGVYVFNESTNLTDVYYTGSMNDKLKITVQSNNRGLWSAKWHYNTLLVDEHVYTGECATECSVCNYTRETSVLHTFDNACDAECNGCDYTREVPEHVYSNNCDPICNICGHDRDQGDDGQWNGLLKEGKTYRFVFDIYSDATSFTVSDSNAILTFGKVITSDESVMVDVTAPLGTAGKVTRIDLKDANDVLYATYFIEIIESTISHVYDSVCDVECNECGESRTAKNNHVYSNDCDTDCNECGATRTVPDHIYDNEYDADCNECGDVREVADPNAPTFVVENKTARVGSTFTVAVSTKNNIGIVSLKLMLGYDADILELVSIEEANFEGTSFGPLTNNPIAINWEDVLNPNNTTNGTVALVTFKVKDTVVACDTEIVITYDPEDVYDENFDNVAFAVEAGTITIIEYTPGDVNSDGTVNNKDLGMLRQYLNGWGNTIDLRAADVTGDGKVNNKDLGILRQYLNGWDVELSHSPVN